MLVAFNLKNMKTELSLKRKITEIEKKIAKNKAFLNSGDLIDVLDYDYLEDEIYILNKQKKMLEWVLN